MFNYLIEIEYDGTKFVGWQYQKNGISVQEKIEQALKKLLKSKIKIIGAGRTDKGVHAYGQCANFKIEKKIENKIDLFFKYGEDMSKRFLSIKGISNKKLNASI